MNRGLLKVFLLSAMLASSQLMAVHAVHAAPALSPLTVGGNHLLRNSQVFVFHGVNRDTLEWGRNNWGGCGGDGHFTDSDFTLISSWHVNTLRIPLSEAAWFGRSCDATMYQTMVNTAVNESNAHGMYVILDLHWSDVGGKAPCGSDCVSGQQPMPDSDSVTFWRQVATRYGANSGVLFDLYNEPHDVSWSCWRNGGCAVQASTENVRYRAVGMQQLYSTVRAYAPTSIILVAGLDWAYDLSGIRSGYAIRGKNIVYDTHVYTQSHHTSADWQQHFGYLTSMYPVSATEWGSTDCSTSSSQQLLNYFDAPDGNVANRMSWTIWGWNAPGDCTQPTVIADWSSVPMPGQGTMVHDALAAYP